MAMKDFNFQKFMLEKGERVGLIAAGVLAALLLVTSLLLPGHGFFSGSSVQNAKQLRTPTDRLARELATNKPTKETDLPPKDGRNRLIDVEHGYIDAGKYLLANLNLEQSDFSAGRRPPHVYAPVEAVARSAQVDVQAYMMDLVGGEPLIYCLQGGEKSTRNPSAEGNRLSGVFGGRGGSRGAMGGLGGMGGGRASFGRSPGGAGRPGGPGRPGGSAGQLPEEMHDKRLVPVRLNQLRKGNYDALAQQVLPLRVVVIGASFPYRKQVEEFRSKLSLRNVRDVLVEPSVERSRDGKALHSMRFLGVKVERREIDLHGKPTTQWHDVELAKDYRPLIVQNGKRFEPEVRKYAKIRFDGLVMPRLMLFRGAVKPGKEGPKGEGPDDETEEEALNDEGLPRLRPREPEEGKKAAQAKHTVRTHWPEVEAMLPRLQETLEALKGKRPDEVLGPPPDFDSSGFNLFGGTAEEPAQKEGRLTAPREPLKDAAVPEHCLIRVIDVNVSPGKSYEYRLKVRMANPNYKRIQDVANPDYAKDAELTDAEWSSPIRVHVAPELRYYAVDEQEVAGGRRNYIRSDRFRDPYPRVTGDQVVLQAHMWLEGLKTKDDTDPLPLGEWVMAERFPVFRGEHIGRIERVQVPVWRVTREGFEIATDKTTNKKRRADVGVYFGVGRTDLEPMVVDFVPAAQQFERPVTRDGRKELHRVADTAGVEVLMVTADGKLQLLDGARDLADPERKERCQEIRDWIKLVKEKTKAGPRKKESPFGGSP